MPYSRTLQQYTTPDFYAEAPASWEQRLREISPDLPGVDHLRFRRFDPHESWNHPEKPIWMLYACKPIAMVDRDRAAQFEKHWSELGTEGEQVARRSVVSNYQHFMWHAHGLYVRPFWILQGPAGGTPAKYSERERRYLDAVGAFSEPFPIGFFPAVPFDERAVRQITMRDRLLKACNNFDALEKMERPAAKQAEDDAAEAEFRRQYLATWGEMVQPQVEFMKSYLKKSEATMALPDAPEGLANTVAQWKDHWLETGRMLSRSPMTKKQIQVAVA